MTARNQPSIPMGVSIVFAIVTSILFKTGYADIAWTFIIVGGLVLGLNLGIRGRKSSRKSARILRSMEAKSTEELQTIWAGNDWDLWSSDDFEVVKQLIIERSATLPQQEPVKKLPCTRCGAMILPRTAEQTGGLCMPCKQGKK